MPDPYLFLTANYTYSPPRADLSDVNTVYNTSRRRISRQFAKRNQFMLCGLIRNINEALRYYKGVACSGQEANLNETYSVHNDPTDY